MDCHGVTDNESLCRLCLEPCTVYYSIFENNATEMLEALTSIRVESGDVFTTLICSGCLSDLTNAYTIQQKIIENHKHLSNSVCIKKEAIEDIPESIFHEENEFNPPEVIKREIKMEVNTSEDPLRIDTNLIAETDYGLIEDDQEASASVEKLLPQKSRATYEKEYAAFQSWKKLKNVSEPSETWLLAYFSEKSKKVKASSLWSYYSMLKATLLVKENCDISKYTKLIEFLKKMTDGYKPKKSKVFEPGDLIRFLKEASNDTYLFMKVIAIMGLYGACRSDELYNLKVSDVDDRGSVLVVSVSDTKTKKDRSFCITDQSSEVSLLELVRKYMALRPTYVPHNKFFVNYRGKKCSVQAVGINTIYKVPRKIADFLKLENPEMYTGHCFRRSSATIVSQRW